jgi:hypothetical protein
VVLKSPNPGGLFEKEVVEKMKAFQFSSVAGTASQSVDVPFSFDFME